jgi:hypothetical protein
LLKYAITNLGVGVRKNSLNWGLIVSAQQLAVNRYLEVIRLSRSPVVRRGAFRSYSATKVDRYFQAISDRQSKLLQAVAPLQRRMSHAQWQLQMDLHRLSQLEALEQFDLFMRQIALQGTKIVVGKLKKMQVISQQSITSLQEKMKIGDVEMRWMAIQVVGTKRYHLESDLLNRLGDANNSVRQAARKALSRLGRGVDFGPSIKASKLERDSAERQWRQWWAVQDNNPRKKLEMALKSKP